MRRILDFLGDFNTVTALLILFGVPVSLFTGLGAAIWAHLEHLRVSYIAVVVLLVFGLTLWSWIGIIWLFDRAKPKKIDEKPPLDCAWGLAIDGAFLTFDLVNPIACQVKLNVRNLHPWPLKCEVVNHVADVDGLIPNMKTAGPTSIVIMQKNAISISFDGYSKGTIPQKTTYKGKIEIRLKYGHPDLGLTREMARFFSFDLQLQPHPFQMLLPQPVGPDDPSAPPLVGTFPLVLSLTKDEEDKPI